MSLWETVQRLSALHELHQVPLVYVHPCTGARKSPLHAHLKCLQMFRFRTGVICQVSKLSFSPKTRSAHLTDKHCQLFIRECSAHGDRRLEEATAGRKARTGASQILGCRESQLQPLALGSPCAEPALLGQRCQVMPALWDVPQTDLERFEADFGQCFSKPPMTFFYKGLEVFL